MAEAWRGSGWTPGPLLGVGQSCAGIWLVLKEFPLTAPQRAGWEGGSREHSEAAPSSTGRGAAGQVCMVPAGWPDVL